MPIEIKELNIRINVNQNQQEQDAPPTPGKASSAGGEGGQDEVIAACVEQVMELLKNKMER